ncbi:MAG TPA: proteasome-activating nucleotidase [Methanocorpusculum sp.]|nr:proteasome-activating nucleotidase [Candidatus Methanocorpusculum equi]HJJ33742.1 proteasome-activating nucleotidase [Methanocorpusculum sp.]HJJ45332.1 proteasome-activating nucleotidase [Methanocorpusculum sp.]
MNVNTGADEVAAAESPVSGADYLRQENTMLQKVMEAQQQELNSLRSEMTRMRMDNLQLKKENAALKRMPLFVASVLEKLPENEVYLRQMGNNQEYVTQTSTEIYAQITSGCKVAVNNTLSIVKILGDTVDARVKVMELEEKPKVTFEDVGGLADEIIEVREAVEYPLTRPEAFERFGVIPPKGVLLYGPPGTGKTLIAKAVANNAGVPFLRLAGSELVHKYIGEGAQLVRDLFTLARDLAERSSGVVVFIDEIDAVGSMRTNDGTSGSAEVQRTLMQLLAEMDGFNTRGNIRIMAATNRPDMLDAALLRPGRFDRLVKVPLPDSAARSQIFAIHMRKIRAAKAVAKDVNVDELVALTEGFNGSQIEAVCREAGMIAIREEEKKISLKQFLDAIRKIKNEEANGIADIMYT